MWFCIRMWGILEDIGVVDCSLFLLLLPPPSFSEISLCTYPFSNALPALFQYIFFKSNAFLPLGSESVRMSKRNRFSSIHYNFKM